MQIIKRTRFNIEKLYLDCVDNYGNCFILYRARMDLFFFRFFYSGLIFSNTEGFTIEKLSFRQIEMPEITNTLVFKNDLLKISGSWRKIENQILSPIFKDQKNNELIWNCHHPKCITEINFAGKIFNGYGYAETISLPLKPWNLPLDELKWGRFLSDDYTIIWINCRGVQPVNKLFFNNAEIDDAEFKEDVISFCGGIYQLRFKEIQPIRKGRLSKIFSGNPWLKFLFNKRILNTLEKKYKAKTSLSKRSESLSDGWSIYETIIWGK
jgi:hypothetical protein